MGKISKNIDPSTIKTFCCANHFNIVHAPYAAFPPYYDQIKNWDELRYKLMVGELPPKQLSRAKKNFN